MTSNSETDEPVSPMGPNPADMTDDEAMFRRIASKATKDARKELARRVFGESADIGVDSEYTRLVRDVIDRAFMGGWVLGGGDYAETLTKKLAERRMTLAVRRKLGL